MKTLEEKNALVAEFMGFVVKDFGSQGVRCIDEGHKELPYYDWLMLRGLEYSTSMDWLYPVWQKLKVQNSNTKWSAEAADFETKIMALFFKAAPVGEVFESIAEAIEWYNKLK